MAAARPASSSSGLDLGEQAYGRIRAAIREGGLAPGTRLTEAALAQRLGASRTPVRQAIARLEAEGLLTREPHRGLVVTRPDHAQVVELYVMREILEGANRISSMVRHDLRGPLQTIKNATFLAEQQPDKLPALRLTERIDDEPGEAPPSPTPRRPA